VASSLVRGELRRRKRALSWGRGECCRWRGV